MTPNDTAIIYAGSYETFIGGTWEDDQYKVVPATRKEWLDDNGNPMVTVAYDRNAVLYGPDTYDACIQWRKDNATEAR